MGHRPKRVAELVLRELGELLRRGAIKDPAVVDITITAVDMAPDLRSAKVFFSVLGGGSETALTGLERARGFVRRELARRLRLKVAPELHFRLDQSLDRAARIERLLDQDRKRIESTAAASDEEGEGGG